MNAADISIMQMLFPVFQAPFVTVWKPEVQVPPSLVLVYFSNSVLLFSVRKLSDCSTASTRIASLNIFLLYFTFKAAAQSLGSVCHTTVHKRLGSWCSKCAVIA